MAGKPGRSGYTVEILHRVGMIMILTALILINICVISHLDDSWLSLIKSGTVCTCLRLIELERYTVNKHDIYIFFHQTHA